MIDNIYLIMKKSGVIKMTKKPPKLEGDERSVLININVEDDIFEYTFMRTELTVTQDDVMEPTLEVQLLHAHDKL